MTADTIRTLCISILTSSLLILAVVLLRALFHKRIRMRLQYALWLFVAVRLLILPVPLLKSPLSVLRLADVWRTAQSSPKRMVQNDFLPDTAGPADSQTAHTPSAPAENRLLRTDLWQAFDSGPEKSTHIRRQIGLLCVTAAGIGSSIVFLYFLIGNIRFALYLRRRRVRFEESGIGLSVYTVEGLPSPCLYGRTIYIAPAMAQNRQSLSHILVHEYCHYRQGDSLWSIVRCLCVALYWWNPLVWLAAALSREDCELACDEAALHMLGQSERLPYGRTLIGLVPVKTNKMRGSSIAATMSEGGRNMKRRIRQIAANPKTARSAGVLLAALALVCFISMSTTASTLPDAGASLGADTEDARIELPGEPTRVYTMQVDEEKDYPDIPTLSLNDEEQTFSFAISALSSYLIFGSYEVEDDLLTAATSDGLYQYTFRIADPETIVYLDGPAVGVPDAPRLTPKLTPGSVFRLSEASGQTISGTAETELPEEAPDAEEAYTQAVHDLDQAVGLSVLSFNRDRYLAAECAAEGHILLGKAASTDGGTIVYALTMYGEYQFQDNAFVKESGSGVIPAVMTFSYDESAGYVLESFELPEDGGYYIESIHELFPEKLWDRCISIADADIDDLTRQEQGYALRYVQQLGRDARIGDYGDFPHTLLTDAGVSVEVSNLLCDAGKFDGMWKYPDWIGNEEWLEDGVRYVYAMSLDDKAHEIIYTKSEYDTGTVIERHVIDALTGEEKQ